MCFKRFGALLVAICLVAALISIPMPVYAASVDDTTPPPTAEDATDAGLVGAQGGTFSPAPLTGLPAQTAPQTVVSPVLVETNAGDETTLYAALAVRNDSIILTQPFAISAPIAIELSGGETYAVTIKTDAGVPMTLTSAASRHFSIIGQGVLHITFVDVTLDGAGTGGGIECLIGKADGTVTINQPQIENCKNDNFGGGLYTNGITRVKDGHFIFNEALRGGGMYADLEAVLNVERTALRSNTALYDVGVDNTGLGGGIGAWENARLTLLNCLIMGNTTNGGPTNSTGLGGGVGSWKGGNVQVLGSIIKDNVAENFGGGIFAHWNTDITVDGGLIQNNDVSGSASYGVGGGLHIAAGGDLLLKGAVKIKDNKAVYAGALRTEDAMVVNIEDGVVFSGNSALQSGGGIYAGSTSVVRGNSTVTVGAATFTQNSALYGGGVYTGRGYTLAYTGTQFTQNAATTSGGAIYSSYQTDATYNNATLTGNTARHGGGVFLGGATNATTAKPWVFNGGAVNGNTATQNAGAIYMGKFNTLTLTDTQVNGNTAAYGGGVAAFDRTTLTLNGSTTLNNNTATSSGGGVYAMSSSVVSVAGSAQMMGNEAALNGGGGYFSTLSTLTVKDAAKIMGNNAGGFGGGIAGAEAASISIEGSGQVSGNTAAQHGGGIYAHGSASVINIKDSALIVGNSAAYGGGISATSPENSALIPTVAITGGTLSNNTASADGGGVWTLDLTKVTVAGGVVFAGNKAVRACYMPAGSPDVATHKSNILISGFSAPAAGLPAFAYGYNNYDIVYKVDVTVAFDVMGGTPAPQTVTIPQGSTLGASMPPNPTRAQYVFMGWFSQPNGGGTALSSTTPVPASITVYAWWVAIVVEPPSVAPPTASSASSHASSSSSRPSGSSSGSKSVSSSAVISGSSAASASSSVPAPSVGGGVSSTPDSSGIVVPPNNQTGWSVVSLMLCGLGVAVFVVASVLMLLGSQTRQAYQDDSEERPQSLMRRWLLVLVMAVGAPIVFLITNNLGQRVVWVNYSTIVIGILFVVEAVLFSLFLKGRHDAQEQDPTHYNAQDAHY